MTSFSYFSQRPDSVNSSSIANDSIVNEDINSAAAIALSKLANVSATDKVLGRSTAGAGAIEEIACTAAGRALLDDADAAAQRTTLGLGTISTQASSSVTITGGSISGITDLAVADGGTGASDASTARTNLGLGSIATQASDNVSITGGAISGATVSAPGVTSTRVTAPSAGMIGEQLISTNGAGVSLAISDTWYEVESLTLTAGIWELYGTVYFESSSDATGNVYTQTVLSATTASGTPVDSTDGMAFSAHPGSKPLNGLTGQTSKTGPVRVVISSNTTYYLNARIYASSSIGTQTADGTIKAVRVG